MRSVAPVSVAVNIANGRSLWTLSLGQATAGSNWRGMPQIPVCNLLYNAGKIYVLTNNGALICVNTGEKRLLWAMAMEGPPVNTNGFFNQYQPTEKIRTQAAIFLKDNVLYFKERDADDMYSVDLSGPSLKWKRPADPNETIVGSRMRSGGLSPESRRGVALMRFANWSCLMSQVTFGYCLVNSSESLKGMSNPVSK